MTDDLPPGMPFMIVGHKLVPPTILLGVLLEVAARHNRAAAEHFAELFFADGDASWGLDDIADAAGVSMQALHDEWQRECNKRYGDKELH